MVRNHLMIDLETAGTRPDAPILTIGAVRFDPYADEVVHGEALGGVQTSAGWHSDPGRFYARVDTYQKDWGRHPDEATVKWWGQQAPDMQYEAWEAEPRLPLDRALTAFGGWCHGGRHLPVYVWSHGAGFDVVLMESAAVSVAEAAGIRPNRLVPWKFWNVRDTRTLYDIAGVKPARGDDHHNALADAIAQAEAVQLAYRKLGISEAA